ncbi:MAG: hypothetical protein A2W61_07720 [Deltaproteobacteria bacterium RIFCSPLOWO2_01_44_7]|nr:MAG: hypothetical protein A2712_00340 [Deltaproteobacteria bacterium RIFCSPHIGHO2_01_FULL_43_49]OGQ15865.1 MAG: hypothetical protein A3D22_02990 [Deltaproteobacteria bacterium RIFCSPHIGHO2_02_FULL_44_53]OGQ28819.1 MAG: hypothetical protein A3D98_01320 [Deltaproteobacteria bacterium RIFCSPHIGHO2_12_FULL_44_21]OGQ32139.1 MAG: hypothetical protein A2979_03445 [Deltaproteobacteria bacterium RIFCSPLOWO2_01_FULL_45_74]OGQ43718.1 MAG: hypothetical protein A3I70_05545 [Deltaproteobacteria bacterium 
MTFNKIYLFFGCYMLLSAFCLWSWAYSQRNEELEKERQRGERIAELLASQNSIALQTRFESMLSLNGVDQSPGVVKAFITDHQGNILVPLAHYGEKFLSAENKKTLLIRNPILGPNKEFLGEAILLFSPVKPNFYSLWVLFLIPLFLLSALYLLWEKKIKTKEISPTVCAQTSSYSWLPVLASWLKSSLYIFDEEGNIVAASTPTTPSHLLDLFPQTLQAQKVLSLVQRLKLSGTQTTLEQGVDEILIGSLDANDGKKHYLLASN